VKKSTLKLGRCPINLGEDVDSGNLLVKKYLKFKTYLLYNLARY